MVHRPAKDPGPKRMLDKYLEELERVYLLKSPDMSHSIEFRGDFMFQSFAHVGILLLSSQIYKVFLPDIYLSTFSSVSSFDKVEDSLNFA
jgi:hypothetical protein